MGMVQVTFDIALTSINCGECGGTYAINERFRQQKHDNGGGWNCPYCKCSWGYFGKTEAQKLKEQLAEEQRRRVFAQENAAAERAAREQTERRLSATKGAKTRIVNRIKNGVCPCCNRTFINLGQHMANQHPDFQAKESTP